MASLQTTVISKNEQVEELQSKLKKKDEIVKELESIQERKSSCYITVEASFHINVFIDVKPLQTEIFDKRSQLEELQTLLKLKTEELESLQECKSYLFRN